MRFLLGILIFLFSLLLCSAGVRYEVPADTLLLELSKRVLISQIGITEKTGHNDGKEVEGYLKSVGLKKGNPWCAAFQYWGFKVSHDFLAYIGYQTEIPIPRTGHANSQFNYIKKHGYKTDYKAQINDLLDWWNTPGNLMSSGHEARVIKVDMAGWVYTIEGNTSNGLRGSQREGNGAFIRHRNIYDRIGGLRVRGLGGFKPDYSNLKIFSFPAER